MVRNNVSLLSPDWVTVLGSDVSATPAVDGDSVYVPDWAGNLYRLDRRTGAIIWQFLVQGAPYNFSRTTPAIHDDLLIFGDQGGRAGLGASVMAVDRDTGQLIWTTKVDDHPFGIVTQSATVHAGVVYVGVASFEELFAALIPNYPCCSFRGSMLALDAETGQILWKTYTVPDGYSGNAVWGSSPSIDPRRGQVYIATGNNYSAPQGFLDCVAAAGDDATAQLACVGPDNHFDSIMALDMESGAIRWATRAIPFDVWTVACIFDFGTGAVCPEPAGPDFDFAQAPILIRNTQVRPVRDMLGVGQKSGQFWMLDPDSGQVLWVTQAGPGGVAGGLQWGSSFDGRRIYTSDANSNALPHVLPDGSSTTSGVFSALDPTTGQILWQIANPAGGPAGGAVSTTHNGLVFLCSLDPDGHMYALDGATGSVLWSFTSGGACNSGAAISRGQVFWGSGYSNLGYTGNTSFYAFGLN